MKFIAHTPQYLYVFLFLFVDERRVEPNYRCIAACFVYATPFPMPLTLDTGLAAASPFYVRMALLDDKTDKEAP